MDLDLTRRRLFTADFRRVMVKRHWKTAGKFLAFAVVLCVSVHFVWRVIVPKFFADSSWPTTSAYLGFYEMEENTVDVLFFGSSHAASFFLPQELYNGYGITGYNLGCEQQNLVVSYFWLGEALRFQKPKAVVLDCYMLFPYISTEPLNTAESCTRKAIDYMKWSFVKKDAVQTICRLDENQSLESYYFPNIRYHKRWEGLSENDFSFSDMAGHYELKGYAPQAAYGGRQDFAPFEIGDMDAKENMVPLMAEYLGHMEKLCRQNGIPFVLVKTPTTAQSPAKSLAIQNFAREHDLHFLDFNEKGLYEKINFCFETDNCDDGHGSIWGARKVTAQIGKKLARWYGLGGHKDSQWEETRDYYEGIKKDCELAHMTDLVEYLQAVLDERYCVFLSAKDACLPGLKPAALKGLKELGLSAGLREDAGCSYLAVILNGKAQEQTGIDQLEQDGAIRDGIVRYEMVSAGSGCGNVSSIKIDGTEYSKNGRGLNFVVYNQVTKRIVDAVCFDINEDGVAAIR